MALRLFNSPRAGVSPDDGNPHGFMLGFLDSPGAPEVALWCAVLWRAWDDLQHPNARIRRDAEAFFASPGFDRIAALTRLEGEAIALIRETARQRATGNHPPVSKFSRKPTRAYQRRSHYLVRHLEFQGEVRPLQEWCRRLRLKPITVYVRLHRGWTVAEALTGRRESKAAPATTMPSHPAPGGEVNTNGVFSSIASSHDRY